MARRYKVFLAVAATIMVLDQIAKFWARSALEKYGFRGYEVVAGYWDMRLSFNTGSAFGLFSTLGGGRIILSVIGLAACVAIVGILKKLEDAQRWLTLALGLVAGGAVGNVIDRILFGKVTDFIVWKIGTHEWPAFNVADSALCVGVAILFLDVGNEQKKRQKSEAKA